MTDSTGFISITSCIKNTKKTLSRKAKKTDRDISLLCFEIFDSTYQSTVFCILNTVCTNSCVKPWRQNSIMTDFQHLLYWTLFIWRKGLCSANNSPLFALIHATMTPKPPQYEQSNTRRNYLLPTSSSLHEFIPFLIYFRCNPVNCPFSSRYLATV